VSVRGVPEDHLVAVKLALELSKVGHGSLVPLARVLCVCDSGDEPELPSASVVTGWSCVRVRVCVCDKKGACWRFVCASF
jgi:hypothetical protein